MAVLRRRYSSLSMISEKTVAEFKRSNEADIARGGAGGSSSLEGLRRMDDAWAKLRAGGWKAEGPQIVKQYDSTFALDPIDQYDVVVCGGTLGIFYALAMQLHGRRVAVIERGKIAGREQEWNISGKEMQIFIDLNIFTQEEIESVKAIEFNPVRVGFKTDTRPEALAIPKGVEGHQFELYTKDVLNLGILPSKLIALAKEKFVAAGGVAIEMKTLTSIDIYDNVGLLSCVPTGPTKEGAPVIASQIAARVIIDCMGNASPISKQVRGPTKPDGICVVVGGCASGFDARNNTYSDLIYTDTPINNEKRLQYFWEAFPAGSDPTDRTTYLFTYLDADEDRPSVSSIFDDYWKLMPRYQGIELEDLQFKRILYGLFPTYRDSPIKSKFDRILAVGDASGIQSPLSFGGFGSLTRHLNRVVSALNEALDANIYNKKDELLKAKYLGLVNSYQPNLSACWMFQRSMSCPTGTNPKEDLIVGILSNSFNSMETLGDAVMKPFLQDVLQFTPLLRTLTLAAVGDILTPLKIVPHVGLKAMLDFFYHFFNMGVFTLFYNLYAKNMLEKAEQHSDPIEAFKLRRKVDQWKFGSGLDYDDH